VTAAARKQAPANPAVRAGVTAQVLSIKHARREREAQQVDAVAAYNAMVAARPLRPPPMRAQRSDVRSGELMLRQDRKHGILDTRGSLFKEEGFDRACRAELGRMLDGWQP
jgi:hypothetical protein